MLDSRAIIGALIKKFRLEHHYSQEFVGSYIGISQRDYSHYENGDYDLTVKLLIRLSSLYNVNIEDMVNAKELRELYKNIRFYSIG